ncbi:MAG: methyltransferase domain-containing protein [Solirubrobacterales bacterium]
MGRLVSPTSALTRRGRARRRFNCGDQARWEDRARSAAALLKAHEAQLPSKTGKPLVIADLGAGNERLRSLLGELLDGEHRYLPFDLHPQLPTTTRLDVKQGLPDDRFDVGVCLGLLEYLPNVPDFLDRLGESCSFALISYVTCDSPVAMPREQRLEHHWVSHFAAAELEAAFAAAGFKPLDRTDCEEGVTTLWLLRQ